MHSYFIQLHQADANALSKRGILVNQFKEYFMKISYKIDARCIRI
jgi:hypothetical protein